jgi:cystathionine beta-lyase
MEEPMTYDFDTVLDRRSSNSIKWNMYPEDVLPLWVADMDIAAPRPILDAVQKKLSQGALGYERPSEKLMKTVAARMDRLYGWKVEPDMVVAVPGIVSGFNAAAKAVCEPGEGIIMQPPVYFPFLQVHENLELTRQYAPLVREDGENNVMYAIDFEAFEAAIGSEDTRTGMFLFCNPHNPTGNAFSREQLSRLAEICLRNDVVICSDEIHSELLLGGTKHTPIATLSPEIAERTITLVAPSKTFNTAGLFCGFAIIPNSDLRESYQKATAQMTLHVNSLGLAAAEEAFSGSCDDWLLELRAYLTDSRDFVASYVQKHMPEIRTTVPEATYLMWFDCSALVESGVITGNLHEFFLNVAKVALNSGADFGPGGENFVRFNLASPRNILEEALERICREIT